MPVAPRTTARSLSRAAALFTAAAAVVLASACSGDSITQPDLTAQASKGSLGSLASGLLSTLIATTPLTRDTPVPAGVVRSFTFDRKGGKIEIKETGLRVDVPADAIPGTTLTIVVTALPGNAVAYDFEPHGTVFLKPLAFRQDLKNTSYDKLGFKGTVTGGYFKDDSQLDLLHGIALLDELFPVIFASSEISFDIKHFSGYMVSTGRQALGGY